MGATVDIGRETDRDFQNGHTTVGASRVQLTSLTGLTVEKGVILRCPGTTDPTPNTVPVWVGGPAVTADSAATGGMPLVPGAAIEIPIDDPSKIWLISTSASQDVAWFII